MSRSFVRDDVNVRGFHPQVHNLVLLATPDVFGSVNHPLAFAASPAGGGAGGSNFVLGPGFQVIEGGGGQVPQAAPGQKHDGSPPAPATANPDPLSASAGPQNAAVVSSPLPSPAPSSLQQAGTSIGQVPPPASALPSGSLSVPTSAATSATSPATEGTLSSLSPLSPVPPTSSSSVATTSTTFPSSTSNTATSSSTLAAAAAINASTPAHGASFWAGIALFSIAVVATIITLFLWWLRVRKRTHKRPWESRWPWRRAESYMFPEDAISSSGTSTSWWQPQSGDHDHVGEPRRSMSNLPSAGMSSSGTGSSHTNNMPHLLPANLSSMSPFAHGPYPTVRPLPLELRRSDTSVPGLVQDVGGSLRVANLVAGDILTSGDESSRPPTALDDNRDRDVAVGTPRESGAMFRPRYLSLNGSGGLDVPWIRTPPTEPGLESEPEREQEQESRRRPRVGAGAGATTPLDHHKWKERLERSSPGAKPAGTSQDSRPPLPAAQGMIEAWRDSLRNNIGSAFGVFASTSAAPVRPSVTAYDWQQQQQQHGTPVERALSTASTISKPWTLEETGNGAGIVHIRGVLNPLAARRRPSSALSSSPSRSNSRPQPLPPTPSSALRSPSLLPPHASLVPPRLPHLPPIPSIPRTSAATARSTSTKRQYGSRRRRGRGGGGGGDGGGGGGSRSLVRCSSLSAASEATSVGSDMSRASRSTAVVVARWTRWARLSEKEEAARRALRQRRLRSIGSGSSSSSSGVRKRSDACVGVVARLGRVEGVVANE